MCPCRTRPQERGDHPHVPALRALRDAGRRRRPGRAQRRQRLRPPGLPGPARLRLAGPQARRRGQLAPARSGRPRGTGPHPARAAGRHGRPPRRAGRLRRSRDRRPRGRTAAPGRAGASAAGRRDGTRARPWPRNWTPWSARPCGPCPPSIATSDWAVRRLVSHHGLAPDRVHVAAPGADIAPLASGTDGVSRLLCVAAVTPRKGQHRLVEALATVTDLPWSCVLRRRPRPGPRVRRPTARADREVRPRGPAAPRRTAGRRASSTPATPPPT